MGPVTQRALAFLGAAAVLALSGCCSQPETPAPVANQLGCVDLGSQALTLIDSGGTCPTGLVTVYWNTSAPTEGAARQDGATG